MAYVSEQSRILKADAVRGMDTNAAFNFDDFKSRCQDYVEQARAKAQQIISQAQKTTVEIKEQAQKEGYAAGHSKGLQNAHDEIKKQAEKCASEMALEKLKTTLPAMQSVSEQLHKDRNRWLAEWENATIKLAVAIAEKIVSQQIAIAPHLATEQIQHLLSLTVGSSRIRLHLNPADLAGLGTHAEEVIKSLSSCGEVQICPDENIDRGGCIIETEHGTVDALIESQLERIADELLTEL